MDHKRILKLIGKNNKRYRKAIRTNDATKRQCMRSLKPIETPKTRLLN